MSDRRSFSEIPQDLLRDHGVDARVDRVWSRLEKNLESTRNTAARPRRFEAQRGALALAAVTFVAGIFVGSRFVTPPPLAAEAALTAEPPKSVISGAGAEATAPAAAAALPGSARETPRPSRHNSAPHRAFASAPAEPAPTTDPEPTPAIANPVSAAEWPRLAEEGQYQAARTSLEQNGGFDAALGAADADQLMSLFDIARATGQRDRGVRALRRIVGEYSGDPNAPVAAWMLANELAKSRDLAGAEQAFATYRALSPGGDFAEDALARQVDMASEQGSLERAKKLAGQYLKEFPDGPRSADIQSQLDRWSRAAAAVAAEPPVEPASPPYTPASLGDAGAPR